MFHGIAAVYHLMPTMLAIMVVVATFKCFKHSRPLIQAAWGIIKWKTFKEDASQTDDASPYEDEDIDEDDEDMDFKMVFVVNKSLELKSGIMSLYVAKSTAGLFKKINAQPQSVRNQQLCHS